MPSNKYFKEKLFYKINSKKIPPHDIILLFVGFLGPTAVANSNVWIVAYYSDASFKALKNI